MNHRLHLLAAYSGPLSTLWRYHLSLQVGRPVSGWEAEARGSRRPARGVRPLRRPGEGRRRSRPQLPPLTSRLPARVLPAEVTMAAALARLGLRAVKEVRVQFCPFEKNVESTRYGVAVRGGDGKGRISARPGVSPLFGPALTSLSHRRTFLQAVSSEKVRSTNLNCSVIADVRHDGSEPCVDVLFGGLAGGAGREGRPAACAPSALLSFLYLIRSFLPQETGIA